jgi:hypothetical protein
MGEKFSKYVGVRGVLAIGMSALIGYLLVKGIAVQNELWTLEGLVLGFYFARTSEVNGLSLPR